MTIKKEPSLNFLQRLIRKFNYLLTSQTSTDLSRDWEKNQLITSVVNHYKEANLLNKPISILALDNFFSCSFVTEEIKRIASNRKFTLEDLGTAGFSDRVLELMDKSKGSSVFWNSQHLPEFKTLVQAREELFPLEFHLVSPKQQYSPSVLRSLPGKQKYPDFIIGFENSRGETFLSFSDHKSIFHGVELEGSRVDYFSNLVSCKEIHWPQVLANSLEKLKLSRKGLKLKEEKMEQLESMRKILAKNPRPENFTENLGGHLAILLFQHSLNSSHFTEVINR